MLWTAFLLGLAGSLHCAAMCGPLVLALPQAGRRASTTVLHHIGRLAAYALIGALFGLAGQSLQLAGFQRWLSLIAGMLLLAGATVLLLPLQTRAVRFAGSLSTAFAKWLPRTSPLARLGVGFANGFLPCGLVYAAATASIAAGSWSGSVLYMAAFGAGTLPMMIGITVARRRILPIRLPARLLPMTVGVTALLLILRGLSLGIPGLSPDLSTGNAVCPACENHAAD